jgi:hypothetical protein
MKVSIFETDKEEHLKEDRGFKWIGKTLTFLSVVQGLLLKPKFGVCM